MTTLNKERWEKFNYKNGFTRLQLQSNLKMKPSKKNKRSSYLPSKGYNKKKRDN